jgi:putative addiction module antidote
MIQSRIREQGNSYVVTIPREAMEKYNLHKGDTISFTPNKTEQRFVLREEVQAALNDVLEHDQDALEYLGQ